MNDIHRLSPHDPLFLSFLQARKEETFEDEWGDVSYNWKWMEENSLFEQHTIWAYVEVQTIQSLCLVGEPPEELHFLPPIPYTGVYYYETREAWETLVRHLQHHYPMLIWDWVDQSDELSQLGIPKADYQFEKGTYLITLDCPNLWGVDPDFIRKHFEATLQKGEVIDIITEVKTQQDLCGEIYHNGESQLPLYCADSNDTVFVGFHYFCPRNILREEHSTFLVAYAIEKRDNQVCKRLVGVLKVGEYGETIRYKGLNYIDVHESYQRMGIASKLYKQLNEWLQPHELLVSSQLSKKGKEANIHQVRKRMVTQGKMFDRYEDLYAYLKK